MMEPQLEEFGETVTLQRAPFELKEGETLRLDIFIDRSIIEVCANGRQCMTQVVYPELDDSKSVKIFSGKKGITVKNVRVWEMASTNPY